MSRTGGEGRGGSGGASGAFHHSGTYSSFFFFERFLRFLDYLVSCRCFGGCAPLRPNIALYQTSRSGGNRRLIRGSAFGKCPDAHTDVHQRSATRCLSKVPELVVSSFVVPFTCLIRPTARMGGVNVQCVRCAIRPVRGIELV